MVEKGYERDTLQCSVKIKPWRQGYQKARESNRRSGAEPKTCRFCKELEAIHSGNSTSTAKRPLDSSAGLEEADAGLNPNKEVMDEQVKLEDDAEQGIRTFGDTGSQDLFSTQEGSSQSKPSGSGVQVAGEGSTVSGMERLGVLGNERSDYSSATALRH